MVPNQSFPLSLYLLFQIQRVNGQVSGKYICRELSKLRRKTPVEPLDKIFPHSQAPKKSLIKYPGFLRAPLCTRCFKVFDAS
jgi:hypothetical protein